MDIKIGKRLRELRSQKQNTQEQLAMHLGITTQAISKWEQEKGYPDISLLPAIASFYDVSIDNLLGVDQAAQTAKLAEYRKKAQTLRGLESVTQRISLWREAYQEFPNAPSVLHNLSFALRAEGFDKHGSEIIHLATRLLKEATQSGEYFGAIGNLCHAYIHQGDLEKAKHYASMAGRYIGTENQLMIHILSGNDAAAFCQWNIETLIDLVSTNANVMLQKGDFSTEESISICKQILRLFALIYEDENYGFYHRRLSKWHMRTASYYAQLQNTDSVIHHLEYAILHAQKYDSLQDGHYTAPMVNRLSFHSSQHEDPLVSLRKTDMNDPCFDFLRSNSEFRKFIISS